MPTKFNSRTILITVIFLLAALFTACDFEKTLAPAENAGPGAGDPRLSVGLIFPNGEMYMPAGNNRLIVPDDYANEAAGIFAGDTVSLGNSDVDRILDLDELTLTGATDENGYTLVKTAGSGGALHKGTTWESIELYWPGAEFRFKLVDPYSGEDMYPSSEFDAGEWPSLPKLDELEIHALVDQSYGIGFEITDAAGNPLIWQFGCIAVAVDNGPMEFLHHLQVGPGADIRSGVWNVFTVNKNIDGTHSLFQGEDNRQELAYGQYAVFAAPFSHETHNLNEVLGEEWSDSAATHPALIDQLPVISSDGMPEFGTQYNEFLMELYGGSVGGIMPTREYTLGGMTCGYVSFLALGGEKDFQNYCEGFSPRTPEEFLLGTFALVVDDPDHPEFVPGKFAQLQYAFDLDPGTNSTDHVLTWGAGQVEGERVILQREPNLVAVLTSNGG